MSDIADETTKITSLKIDSEAPTEITSAIDWLTSFLDFYLQTSSSHLPHHIIEGAIELLCDLTLELPLYLALRRQDDAGAATGTYHRTVSYELKSSACQLIATIRALQALLDGACGHKFEPDLGKNKDQEVIGSSLRSSAERDRVVKPRDAFERSEESNEGGAQ